MADYTSSVIIDVNLNADQARARATQLSNSIVELRDQQDQLRASGLQLGNTYRQNSQQIRTLESETRAYLNISNQQTGSINSLRAQIILLNNQYNALSAAERNSTVAGQALQRQLAALRQEERDASQAAGNFSTNIGNYTQSILQATAGMNPFAAGIINSVQSINSLATAFGASSAAVGVFSTAIATTGIGVLIVGVGSLIAYLKDLDTFTDNYEQTVGGLKASFNELGRSILNLDFSGLGKRLKQAGVDAADIVALNQDLEDKLLIQSVKSADDQEKIAQKRAQAANRVLDPNQRIKLLQESQEIDKKDLEARAALADERIENARSSIALTGNLDREELTQLQKKGVEYALELQNNSVRAGKVTDAQTKELAEALKNRTQIQQEFTQRDETANNRADRIADQAERKKEAADAKAEAQAKELQQHLDQINQDRLKSELNMAQSVLTVRQKEFADINYDIDKRKKLYEKYGQDTTQLEKERLARISALNAQFRSQDLDVISRNNRATQNIRTGLITDPTQRKQQALDDAVGFSLEDIDKQILAVAARIALGEQGLTDVLQSYVNQRKAIVDKSNADDAAIAEEHAQHMRDIEQQSLDAAFQAQVDDVTRQQAIADQKAEINSQLITSYESLAGSVVSALGKQTTIGKVALAAQKAFAIAEIIINGEREKAAINARYAILKLQASLIPFGGAFLIAALTAAQGIELGVVTAREVTGVATIAAQAVSGFSDGGYVSGPGSGTSDSIPARLSNGEFVMNARATQMFAPLISSMNQAAGGKGFATGGPVGGFVPNLTGQVDSNNAITRAISVSMQQLRPVVYVEDINYGQNNYAVNVQAGNF